MAQFKVLREMRDLARSRGFALLKATAVPLLCVQGYALWLVFSGRVLAIEIVWPQAILVIWAAVPAHRVLLIGTPARWMSPPTRETVHYFGQSALHMLVAGMILIAAAIGKNSIIAPTHPITLELWQALYAVAIQFAILRISLYLPAVALGARPSLAAAWTLTRSAFMTHLLAAIVSVLLVALISAAATALAALAYPLGDYLLFGFLCLTSYAVSVIVLLYLSAGYRVIVFPRLQPDQTRAKPAT